MSLQIHLSIETLEAIVEKAKAVHKETPELTTVIRISKTADRQFPALEDKFNLQLLTTHPEIVEG